MSDWPEGKPRIVGYGAKWEEDSAGWRQHGARASGWSRKSRPGGKTCDRACEKVWALFGLTGFVRVDFRVDDDGAPLILEINANPCISPDAGFAAAAAEAGMSYDDLIEAIVEAAQ